MIQEKGMTSKTFVRTQTSKEKALEYFKSEYLQNFPEDNEFNLFESLIIKTLDIAIRSEQEIADKRVADVFEELDDEIEYLENHVLNANKGIEINIDRIKSWIFEAKKIKDILKQRLGVK